MAQGGAHAHADVLDIGDSHTFFTQIVWGYPSNWDVDAEGGRAADEAARILRREVRPRHDEVVFDIATNNATTPGTLRRDLARVWHSIDGRDLTLVTFYNYCCPGEEGPANTVITDFKAQHPDKVSVAHWGTIAQQHPEWWGTDGLHYNAAGYYWRKRIVAAAVAT